MRGRWPWSPPASADRVFTVDGAAAPGPARYDRVRVIEQGPRKADNVLVLVPGTSGGAAYFRPVARDIVAGLPGWKTWSVDRRENLLEDHSVLGPVVARERPARDAFRYYLESITDTSIAPRFTPVADAGYARRWGMGVAVRDLRNVDPRRAPRRPARRARRSLTRRHDRHRVRDLGLRGPRRSRGPRGPRADRRRQRRGADPPARGPPAARRAGRRLALPRPQRLRAAVGDRRAQRGRLDARRAGARRAGRARRLAAVAGQPAAAGAGHQRGRLRLRDRQRHLAGQTSRSCTCTSAGSPRPATRARGPTASSAPSPAPPRCSPASRASTARPGTTRAASASTARRSPAASPTRPSGCSGCAPRTAATSSCRSTRSRPRSAPAGC